MRAHTCNEGRILFSFLFLWQSTKSIDLTPLLCRRRSTTSALPKAGPDFRPAALSFLFVLFSLRCLAPHLPSLTIPLCPHKQTKRVRIYHAMRASVPSQKKECSNINTRSEGLRWNTLFFVLMVMLAACTCVCVWPCRRRHNRMPCFFKKNNYQTILSSFLPSHCWQGNGDGAFLDFLLDTFLLVLGFFA